MKIFEEEMIALNFLYRTFRRYYGGLSPSLLLFVVFIVL